jgi:hypothetical protein
MSGLRIEEWAARLGGEVDRDQHGELCIRCPGPDHSNGDRSLTVYIDDDDPDGFRVGSFAGDNWQTAKDYVRQTVGLPGWRPKPKANGHAKPNGARKAKRGGTVVEHYDYQNADGWAFHRVTRFADPKWFMQSHRVGDEWVDGGVPQADRVPFRLPEIIEAVGLGRTIYIVEGEKSANKLWEFGLAATCSPGGAEKWLDQYAHWLEGATVIVLADNDEPGRKHVEMVRKSLTGVAETVRVIHLPGLKDGEDVFNWIEAGNDPAAIVDLPESAPGKASGPPHAFTAAELQGMTLPPPKEIVPRFVAAGLTVLAGKPKVRKSWLALDMCLAVARGGWVLGQRCEAGDVLYAALEDGPRRLQARLRKIASMGDPWPSRLTFWTHLERLDEGGEDRLRQWLAAQPDPRLIVIDTFGLARPSRKHDEDPYSYDSRSARLLKALADEYGVGLMVVHHTRKMEADDPLETVSGTNALSGSADATLVLSRTSAGATLYGRSRDLEDVELAVEFDRDTCRWRALGDAREVRQSDERKAILDALREAGEPMAIPDLVAETGMKSANLRKMLQRLGRGPEPDVIRVERGKYALPLQTRSQRSQGHKLGESSLAGGGYDH